MAQDQKKSLLVSKRVTCYLNLVVAVILIVAAIMSLATSGTDLDASVPVMLFVGAACAAVFAMVPNKIADLGNLVSACCIAYALAAHLIASINTIVNAMTGITMFNSGSSFTTVVALAAIMAAALVVEIVSCFMSRDAK